MCTSAPICASPSHTSCLCLTLPHTSRRCITLPHMMSALLWGVLTSVRCLLCMYLRSSRQVLSLLAFSCQSLLCLILLVYPCASSFCLSIPGVCVSFSMLLCLSHYPPTCLSLGLPLTQWISGRGGGGKAALVKPSSDQQQQKKAIKFPRKVSAKECYQMVHHIHPVAHR